MGEGLERSVIDDQIIEAQDVVVPFDLSGKIGDGNADVLELEEWWVVLRFGREGDCVVEFNCLGYAVSEDGDK